MTRRGRTPDQKKALGARLQEARDQVGLTQEELAEALGVSRDTYSKYEGRTPIPPDLALQAAKLLGVTLEFLVTLDGVNPGLTIPDHSNGSTVTGTKSILVKGSVQAGLFREALEWPPGDWEKLEMPGEVPYADKPLQALKVSGPSMNQWYPDGSYVVFVPTIYLKDGWLPTTGQHVIVQRTNEWQEYEATVKEVAYDGADLLLWPRSEDPEYSKPWRLKAPKRIDPDDTSEPIRITGLLVWAIRKAPGV